MSLNQLHRQIQALKEERELTEELTNLTLTRLEAGQITITEENTLAAA